MSSAGATPSPVRQVRQYEKDMEIAKKLQQMYDDEHRAVEMEEEIKVEDEFDAATRKFHEEQDQKFLSTLAKKEGITAEQQQEAIGKAR
jgi:hypothetical protein